ncbi:MULTISPECIES: DUF2771 domain-containing protein [Streptomyces]|uniref:DUF2771 domain-containing protein n=1 Tax=Streptomyces atratus TaxID=1893 RepID=A0A2Z5JHT0_STRAR|nr:MULTISPECIES: DUF2771 domain-containing protein [Streptomyces]AXE79345.1 DUF2771 domain-containing protein [Streptomyces atratus]MEE1808568.1 DUF2771 domain-containing protein [Streptomyces sp. BE133]WPW30474.1 DUF2771 domain-containing protein [Streptomyces atratus]GGT61209.1 lipoprotein [Streptomyces atratus]
MTVAFFSGKGRRIGVALGAVSAGLLVLSACDKPTPLATVTVGGDTVSTEASCYNDGNALKASDIQDCLNKKAQKTVEVAMDDKVRFGVDPEIADNGWTLFINGQQAEQEPYKKTYRSIPGSAFFSSQTGETVSNKTQISIVETKGKKLTGVWHFELKKTS